MKNFAFSRWKKTILNSLLSSFNILIVLTKRKAKFDSVTSYDTLRVETKSQSGKGDKSSREIDLRKGLTTAKS
jgi:hypothetical protein